MIEVFKTNVKTLSHAGMLIDEIRIAFGYDANFDLQDCDKILRVKSLQGPVKAYRLIRLLKDFGFHAEVLLDHLPGPNESISDHIKTFQ